MSKKSKKELTLRDIFEQIIKLDKKIDKTDKSLFHEIEDLRNITEKSFDNLERRVAMKVDVMELSDKFGRLDIRVDEIHEVTVGLEEGELKTGKSLRKMQKIVHRLQHETR